MKIINSMFGKGLGGIEQAFVDYAEALAWLGHEVICVMRPDAAVIPAIYNLKKKYPENITVKKIHNLSKLDISTRLRLGLLLRKEFPDVVICHGNRPSALFRHATAKHGVPQIGVVHNYLFHDVMKSDFLFCVSRDIRTKIITRLFVNDRVFRVPNLIRIGASPVPKPRSEPPVIGMMARMVEKKGVDIFINACGILRAKDVKFSAVIGGEGPLLNKMQSLRDELRLNDNVRFIGWVKDKEKFYNDIDIFCLPSLSEPFGIVLLEATIRGRPIVSTNIEGPGEILENGTDAILCDRGSPEKLAAALEDMLRNSNLAAELAENAFEKVKTSYDISVVAKIIEDAIEQALVRY